ncbi:MAG: hypothetical protein WEA56_07065 [Balneolaceae bacterium]
MGFFQTHFFAPGLHPLRGLTPGYRRVTPMGSVYAREKLQRSIFQLCEETDRKSDIAKSSIVYQFDLSHKSRDTWMNTLANPATTDWAYNDPAPWVSFMTRCFTPGLHPLRGLTPGYKQVTPMGSVYEREKQHSFPDI